MTSKLTGEGDEEADEVLKKCLNVRQKLGTWKFFNVFLRFPMFSNVFQCYLLSFSLSLTMSLSHTLSLSHSFNLSFTHSRHAEQVLFSCLCSKVTLTHSLSLSLSLS